MRTDRAQSESIGVVLLLGVVVVLVAGSGAAVLALGDIGADTKSVRADLRVEATTDGLTIEHLGGSSIAMSDSAVLVRGISSEERYGIDPANVTGDGDTVFEPGERFAREHGIGGDTATILVVDTAANQVLTRASLDLTAADDLVPWNPELARWHSTTDWDGAVSATSVVHDDFGDRTGDTVALGAPAIDWGGSALSGYWPLDEDGGSTATDVSSNDNDGTIETSGTTLGRTGIAGTTSYGFDGTGGHVVVSDDPTLPDGSSFTVSVWLKTTSFSDDNQMFIVSQQDYPAREGYVLLDNGPFDPALTFRVLGAGSFSDVTVPRNQVNDGRWHHIVGTHSASETVLYLDGQQVDRQTGVDFDPAPVDLSVGARTDQAKSFAGDLDGVRIYDRPLDADEVEDLYNVSRAGTLTTGTKTFVHDVPSDDLTLRNVSATRPAGTGVAVTVLSDPDDDGTFEETSDTLTIDGSASYDVTGLSSDSRRFRLQIELTTTAPTVSPTVDQFDLAG